MPSPLDILVFNWLDRLNPRAGGAEVHLHEVFGRLVRRGHRVTLVCSGWPDGATREPVDGIEVHRVGGRESYFLAARSYYRRALATRRFDVVVEDLNKAPLYTPRWADAPVVLLVHHLFGGSAFLSATPVVAGITWALERTLRLAYRGVPAITVSESTAEELTRRGLDAESITVVHNGVDDRLLDSLPLGLRSPEPTVLYLGRLERYKRVDLVVRAVHRLRAARTAAHLIVAGGGRSAPSLHRLVHRLGLGEHVTFMGRVSDAAKRSLMERAWVHTITSTKEGWGITVLEAAACGTPTVASDTPGLRDAVVHGETGLLVRHGDTTALADALRALLADRERRERLGHAARERAERFTWDAAADAIEAHLAAVARRERPEASGDWARFRGAPPHATIGLPRTGSGIAPFGAASWVVEADHDGAELLARVTIGATDQAGHSVIATVHMLHTRRTTVVELPGWPVSHASLVAEVLARAVGEAVTVRSVRRIAEPGSPATLAAVAHGAPASAIAQRDHRVDRRRAPRRAETGDHPDRRQR